MIKKVLGLLLALTLLLASFSSCSSNDRSLDDAPNPDLVASSDIVDEPAAPLAVSEVPMDTLMVGTVEMLGDFISGFGTNSADQAIVTLIGGYMSTYAYNNLGEIVLNNTVVADVKTDDDNDGNRTYHYTLHDDIFWNNGEPITSRDYVASILWNSSPQWVEAGGYSLAYNGLLGYESFSSGESEVFSGVQLISDLEFSVTVAAENLPYFWEFLDASVYPIHFNTYLPFAQINSDTNGSSLEFSEGDLLTNCTRIATEERYAPTVTCGPYSFVSFENQTVTLEINEHFKGDLDGEKPKMQYVVQTAVPFETNVEWVVNGQIDLLTSVTQQAKIDSARSEDSVYTVSYPSTILGHLAVMGDYGPTADVNVRWALASLIDRNEVLNYTSGGYGSIVDSEYTLGQWMYQELAADLQAELKPISFNIDTANDYLDETQWRFEQDATTPFDRSKATDDGSYLRYNELGEPLVINYLGQEGSGLTDIIEIQYIANAPLAGLQFNVERGEWAAVLANYYNAYEIPEQDRVYSAFGIGTSFTAAFDRYNAWHSDNVGTPNNRPQFADTELDAAIDAMRESDPEDIDGYLDSWMDYQLRWNEMLPSIPLYTTEIYDIAHVNVDNLYTNTFAKYENVICKISKSEK